MNKKKLYKIEDGKKIAGVCGGLAEYLNMDPTIIRLIDPPLHEFLPEYETLLEDVTILRTKKELGAPIDENILAHTCRAPVGANHW